MPSNVGNDQNRAAYMSDPGLNLNATLADIKNQSPNPELEGGTASDDAGVTTAAHGRANSRRNHTSPTG